MIFHVVMKTAYDIAEHAPPRAIPVYVVLPKPREFIRGGTAALVNILCMLMTLPVMNRYISNKQSDVPAAINWK